MNGKKLFLIWMLASSLAVVGCSGGGGGTPPTNGALLPGNGNGEQPPPPGPVEGTVFNTVSLADLGGNFSAGIAVNNGGIVAGVSEDQSGHIKGVRWNLDIAGLTGVQLNPLQNQTPAHTYSAAYGLNNIGNNISNVVGESGGNVTQAVYWANSSDALALSSVGIAAGAHSAAYAINSSNVAVGEAGDGDGSTVAIYWPGLGANSLVLADLSVNPGTAAYFINDHGLIVGESRNTGNQYQAVFWMPVNNAYGAPTGLATVPNQVASVAFGVDGDGRIVGEAELAGGVVNGVIWDSATGNVVANLGANTSAQAINSLGDVVVGYTAALSGNDKAAAWNRLDPTDMQEFEPFSQAYGVNDMMEGVGIQNNQATAVVPAL